MSVLTTISLLTKEIPADVPLWLPALFRVAGVMEARRGDFTKKGERRSLSRASAETAAAWWETDGLLHLDFGASPRARELHEALRHIGVDSHEDHHQNQT